jgi:signal transduction histidine kinase
VIPRAVMWKTLARCRTAPDNDRVSSLASVGTPPRVVVGYRLAALAAVLLPLITALVSAGRWATRNPLTFAESDLEPAMLAVLLVASALVPAAVFAAKPHVRSAIGLAIASVGSQVPFWAAWPGLSDELRSAALAVAPLTIAGVAASVHGWTTRSPSKALRASYLFVALAVTIHLLGYDPFADPGCARTCGDVAAPLEFALTAQGAVGIVAGLSVLAAGFGIAALLRSRAPALLIGCALAALGLLVASAVTRWLTWGDSSLASWLILLGPAAPGLVAGAVCAIAFSTARSRRAVSRLVDSLSKPEQSSRVAYAVPGSDRWVDAEGQESSPDGAGVVLSDRSGPVIRLAPLPGTDQAVLLTSLTPAARLALRNAQLSAAATARLADLHASQRRIIANDDAERRRIERDLHDGAQQRLVSVLVQLQLVARDVPAGDQRVIMETDRRLRTMLGRLRRLDLDPFPETLSSEGLEVALEELVANSNAPAELHASIGRITDEIDRAVYAFAATVVEAAQHESPSTQVAIRVWEDEGAIHVRARLEAVPELSPIALIEVADRTGAVGGRVAVEPPANGSISIEAVIPCAP